MDISVFSTGIGLFSSIALWVDGLRVIADDDIAIGDLARVGCSSAAWTAFVRSR